MSPWTGCCTGGVPRALARFGVDGLPLGEKRLLDVAADGDSEPGRI